MLSGSVEWDVLKVGPNLGVPLSTGAESHNAHPDTMSASNVSGLGTLEKDFYSPLLLGGFSTFALWGIIYLQVFNYLTGEVIANDRFYMKFAVGFLWCWESLVSAMNAHTTYFFLVSNFGNPSALATPIWSLDIFFALKEVQMLLIRCLFLHRLFVMSRGRKLLTGWVLLWSLVEFSLGILITVKFFGFRTIQIYPKQLYNIVYAAEASLIIADISLAAALCHCLYKSRTGIPQMDSILRVLMLYSVNTTVLVVIVTVISTSLFFVGSNFQSWPLNMAQTRLYFISYMASVNMREGLRRQIATERPSFDLSSLTVPTGFSSHAVPESVTVQKSHGDVQVAGTDESYPAGRDELPHANTS